MAEYDNIQLYSNYQSYNANNDDYGSIVESSSSRVAWNNKRKKINHYDESMTAIKKCHRPNNNYRTRTTTTKAPRLIAAPSSSHTNLSQTSLITNYQDNNKNKCATMSHSIEENEDNFKTFRRPYRKYFSCYNKSNAFTLALLLVIGLSFQINLCCGFILDGTQSSYAQFRKWYTGLNGTLELEFKTEQPNGLVLYTDDGGTYDFFELKLVEGALRLRYNLGGGAQIITVGRDLHDGHWHKVQVSFSFRFYFKSFLFLLSLAKFLSDALRGII
jgi:Laminin G domain